MNENKNNIINLADYPQRRWSRDWSVDVAEIIAEAALAAQAGKVVFRIETSWEHSRHQDATPWPEPGSKVTLKYRDPRNPKKRRLKSARVISYDVQGDAFEGYVTFVTLTKGEGELVHLAPRIRWGRVYLPPLAMVIPPKLGMKQEEASCTDRSG